MSGEASDNIDAAHFVGRAAGWSHKEVLS
jgi:hypothetical protein